MQWGSGTMSNGPYVICKLLKMSKQSIVTQQFFKDLFQLSKKEQKQVTKTIKLMEQDIKHPSLNCHEVKGISYHEVYEIWT